MLPVSAVVCCEVLLQCLVCVGSPLWCRRSGCAADNVTLSASHTHTHTRSSCDICLQLSCVCADFIPAHVTHTHTHTHTHRGLRGKCGGFSWWTWSPCISHTHTHTHTHTGGYEGNVEGFPGGRGAPASHTHTHTRMRSTSISVCRRTFRSTFRAAALHLTISDLLKLWGSWIVLIIPEHT